MSYHGYGETDASGNLILVPDEPGPPNPNPPQPIFVPGESGPGCGPGEEFDLTSMQCVTAGQAVTPVLPPAPESFVQGGGGGGSDTGIPYVKSSMVPWLIGGGIAIGALALLAAAFSKPRARPNRSRPNPRRPPKKWFDDCVSGVEASGKAVDPYSVCGALWHRKMGPKAKAKALRAERSR